MSDTRKEFPCDVCGCDDAIEAPYSKEYSAGEPVHICCDCGFVYVRMRRSSEEIAKAWSNEVFGDRYTARIPAVVARQTYVADFIDTTLGLAGKTVCDIGAGEGQFLEIARDRYGAKVFGTEHSESFCASMKKKDIDCFQGAIEDFAESGKAGGVGADIVTIMWTLENCTSCNDMLSAAYEIVKDDGHVVVATGSRILVPFKKPMHYYFHPLPQDTHSFHWSANSLRGILANAGFKTTEINRYIDSDVLAVVAQKRPAGEEIEREKDDFLKVHDFFRRWGEESVYYR